MAIRYSNPKVQYFYANGSSFGEPLVDGFVYFYDSGTLNLKNTYANSGLSIVNPNPMRLDGAGRINAPFLDGNYRVVLQDKDGAQQFEIDPVQGSLAGGQWENWDITTSYAESDIVRASDNFYYKSITNNNLGNNPVSSSADWSQILFIVQWNENETYLLNDNVIQDGTQYKSLQDDNLNNPPDVSPAFWGVPTGGLVAGNPVSLLVNDAPYLDANNNLSDAVSASASRTNLDVYSKDETDSGLDAKLNTDGSNNMTGTLKIASASPDIKLIETDNIDNNARLRVENGDFLIQNITDLEPAVSIVFKIDLDGSTTLSYNGSDKLYTNSGGATVVGQASVTGLAPTSLSHLTRKDYVDDRVLNKNWVSKWSGNANSVVNSWGDGEYLVRLDMPSSNDYAFRLTVSGSIKVGISMYFNPYSYGVLYNGSSFVFSNENSGHPIIQIWKAE